MPSSSSSSSSWMTRTNVNMLVTVGLFALPPLAFNLYCRTQKEKQRRNSSLMRKVMSDHGNPIRPPFPVIIKQLLSHCRLAYLSTVDMDSESSHLSLMRFTYLPDEELIILSTNKDTKKYQMLKKQRGVSLLVHDFGEKDGSGGSLMGYSITLNGKCQIQEGTDAERYRDAHLKHNPDYPQFIVGENIAILCINVSSARICDIRDQVQHWSVVPK